MLIIVFFACVRFIKCIALKVQFNFYQKTIFNLILRFGLTKSVPYIVSNPVIFMMLGSQLGISNINRVFLKKMKS